MRQRDSLQHAGDPNCRPFFRIAVLGRQGRGLRNPPDLRHRLVDLVYRRKNAVRRRPRQSRKGKASPNSPPSMSALR